MRKGATTQTLVDVDLMAAAAAVHGHFVDVRAFA